MAASAEGSGRIGEKRPFHYMFYKWRQPRAKLWLPPFVENVGKQPFFALPARLLGFQGGMWHRTVCVPRARAQRASRGWGGRRRLLGATTTPPHAPWNSSTARRSRRRRAGAPRSPTAVRSPCSRTPWHRVRASSAVRAEGGLNLTTCAAGLARAGEEEKGTEADAATWQGRARVHSGTLLGGPLATLPPRPQRPRRSCTPPFCTHEPHTRT